MDDFAKREFLRWCVKVLVVGKVLLERRAIPGCRNVFAGQRRRDSFQRVSNRLTATQS